MDDKLFNDIEKEIQEQNTFDSTLADIDEVQTKKNTAVSIGIAVFSGIVLATIILLVFSGGKKEADIDDVPVIEKFDSEFKEISEKEEITANKDVDPSTAVKKDEAVRSFDEEAEKMLKSGAIKPTKKVVKKPVAKKKVVRKATETVIKPNLWSLQVLSGQNKTAVENEWKRLVSVYSGILKGKEHAVIKFDLKGKTYYRLRVVNIPTLKDANTICDKLKANKVTCFVTK